MSRYRRFFATVSAMTIVFGMLNTAVYASRTYDLNDAEYQQEVDSMDDNIYREEDIVKILNKYEEEKIIGFDNGDGDVKQYKELDITKHLYSKGEVKERSDGTLCSDIGVEYESYYLSDNSYKYRYFTYATIYWNDLKKDELKEYTADELNGYLKENGLKAHFEDYDIKYDSTKLKDVIDTYIALNEKYGISFPNMAVDMGSGKNYIVPSENQSKVTLKGDADLNGDVDLADLTILAKYNLNNEAYPLANEAAYANADMNGDGVVDGLDTSALIENQLGK